MQYEGSLISPILWENSAETEEVLEEEPAALTSNAKQY